ncbi:hypothetical protein [Bradyrhizobium sp.]|jgi:hypothetical protein|uniref:hypothetical protein n=1 Tax=Bradyrhizobium sp. TaxID=376 RepID=UPI002C3A3713|nr:hypothetical protein [Bradyrhizobium sp.]HWX57885.1 hypothetical protein [Bradyrhizobium sp.]
MAVEQRVSRIQPRLVVVEERFSQADAAWPSNAAAQSIQIVQTERSTPAGNAPEFAAPIASMPDGGDAQAQSPNYHEALEMISSAALTMASIEDQSHRIRANAFALTQRVRSERFETDQQISVLQGQLEASHFVAEQLRQQLAQAEERASVAEEWLQRFQEAIASAFAARRTAEMVS